MTANGPMPIPSELERTPAPGVRLRRPTVLVVDDEPEVLQSVHDLLRLEYRVLTCLRGDEALELLVADPTIQVILSDQRMPEMSGTEVLGQARRLRPEVTRLLFTAYADIKAVIDAINQGSVYRYIRKPCDADDLQMIVRQAVGQNELIVERDRLLRELTVTNQRLMEANRLRSAFIEVASHELNTPVAVVLGLAQLWRLTQWESATPAVRHWVERMQNAGSRLARTVEKMLKLIRSDEFGQPLETRPTALGPLLLDAVREMGPFLEARKQHIELDVDPGLGEADLDSAKVHDVFTNLLNNAIKFTPDGGTVRVEARPISPDRVRFEIIDQGIGIAQEVRPFVFEPFFTGFDTMHHSSGEFEYGKRGIGLGLCLVKRFVELHGGSVELISVPGAGTTFAFELPRRPPAPTGNEMGACL